MLTPILLSIIIGLLLLIGCYILTLPASSSRIEAAVDSYDIDLLKEARSHALKTANLIRENTELKQQLRDALSNLELVLNYEEESDKDLYEGVTPNILRYDKDENEAEAIRGDRDSDGSDVDRSTSS